MSITSRSKRQSGWLPVRTTVATGTGGTVTCLVTVSEPVRQPPAHDWVGDAGAEPDWPAPEPGWPEPGWPEPEPDGVLVAHDATLTAAASAVHSAARTFRWWCMMLLSGLGARGSGSGARSRPEPKVTGGARSSPRRRVPLALTGRPLPVRTSGLQDSALTGGGRNAQSCRGGHDVQRGRGAP